VTITGTNFGGGASVSVAGLDAIAANVASTTRITFTTPAHAEGAVDITVRNIGGQAATWHNAFTYQRPPIALTVSPTSGPTTGGTPVTIIGADFTSGMTVQFDGVNASNVMLVSSTELRAVAPAGNAGGAVVTVRNAQGVSAVGTPTFLYVRVVQAGEIISGAIPQSGFGLIVVQAGTIQQVASRSGCTATTLAFWVTDAQGQFIVYVPGTSIGAVNAPFMALFAGGALPTGTAMIARCR
jgi:hypothetical protein